MALDFPANPAVGDEYQGFKWDGNSWVPIAAASGGGIPEAPIDTKTYGRKDAAWAEITSGATGDFLPLTGGTVTGVVTFSGANYQVIDKPTVTDWSGIYLKTGGVNQFEWDLTDNNNNMVLRRFAAGMPKLVQQIEQATGVTTYFGPLNLRGVDAAPPTLSFNDEFTGSDIWTVKSLAPNQSLYFTSYGANAKGDMFIIDAKNDRIDCMCPLFVNNTPVTMMTQHQAALDLIAKLEARLTALEAKSKTGSK